MIGTEGDTMKDIPIGSMKIKVEGDNVYVGCQKFSRSEIVSVAKKIVAEVPEHIPAKEIKFYPGDIYEAKKPEYVHHWGTFMVVGMNSHLINFMAINGADFGNMILNHFYMPGEIHALIPAGVVLKKLGYGLHTSLCNFNKNKSTPDPEATKLNYIKTEMKTLIDNFDALDRHEIEERIENIMGFN